MDYIPSLAGSTSQLDEVPYYDVPTVSYDGQGVTYGGQRLEDGVQHFSERFLSVVADDPKQGTAAAQSWLFFGTMKEVFGVYNLPFLEQDFVTDSASDKKVVTMRMFHSYMTAWIIKASECCPAVLRPSGVDWKGPFLATVRARLAFDKNRAYGWCLANNVLNVVDAVGTTLLKLQTFGITIEHAIWDSIVILCTNIIKASYFAFRGMANKPTDDRIQDLHNVFGYQMKVHKVDQLLSMNGWCPREGRSIQDVMDGDPAALLYCAQLSRRDDAHLHDTCDSSICKAYQVDESIYQTQHVDSTCNCRFLGIGRGDAAETSTGHHVSDQTLNGPGTVTVSRVRSDSCLSPYHSLTVMPQMFVFQVSHNILSSACRPVYISFTPFGRYTSLHKSPHLYIHEVTGLALR